MIDRDDDRVRDRAYALWENAGSPEGQDWDFWHQAERELAEETGDDSSEAAPLTPQPAPVAGTIPE